MKLKFLQNKFQQAIEAIYGGIKKTKAAINRLNTPVTARKGTFESSMTAAIARDVRRGTREAARKNTRGLPKGWSRFQARAARHLAVSLKSRDLAPECLLKWADDFIQAEERTERMRKALRRPSKLSRRVRPARRSKSPKQIQAQVRKGLAEAERTGRTPFTFGSVKARAEQRSHRFFSFKRTLRKLSLANVRDIGGGAIEVTPA